MLHFEGDRNSRLRLLRAVKNRFGPVDEIGCFDLSDDGMVEVADPTGLFVSHHPEPIPGTCVTVTVEGRRPLLAEVQALVTPASGPQGRRAVSGLDSARRRHGAGRAASTGAAAGRPGHDVYAATVGGAALRAPAADLALAIALASAATQRSVPSDTVAIGEVGLAGELRRVPHLRERLTEAARLGFRHAIVPVDHGAAPAPLPTIAGLAVIECPDLGRALRRLQVVGDAARDPVRRSARGQLTMSGTVPAARGAPTPHSTRIPVSTRVVGRDAT